MKPWSKVHPIFPYLNDSGSVFSAQPAEVREDDAQRMVSARSQSKRVRNRPGMMNEHDIPTDRYNTPHGVCDGRTSGAESWLVGVGPVSLPAEYATQKRWMNRCPALAR